MADTSYSLKDDLYNEETVTRLARCIKRVYPDFDQKNFLKDLLVAMPALELKERMTFIAQLYERYLTDDFLTNTEVLLASVKDEEEGHFIFGSHAEYVQIHGCKDEHVDYALKTLGVFTEFFSAEFAIRDFINQYPEKTFDAMMTWSLSDNVHQRRLASEGLRPKLPWAKGIQFDVYRGMLPLHNLYKDSERYVTRSVANHLNDLSKIDPDFVVKTLKEWQQKGEQNDKEMSYVIHHSLRTSIKRGHTLSLNLIGYEQNPEMVLSGLTTSTPELKLGESLIFEFDVLAQEATKLMIDYVVTYPMAGGKRSDKVFKLKKVAMEKGQTIHLRKQHPFRAMTTKKLYAGDYQVTLQINGKPMKAFSFKMTM